MEIAAERRGDERGRGHERCRRAVTRDWGRARMLTMAGACGMALAGCDYDMDDRRRARAPATPPVYFGMAEVV